MQHFILMVADAAFRERAAGQVLPYGYKPIWHGGGATLFCNATDDQVRLADHGIVIGPLFDRSAREPLGAIDPANCSEILCSAGRTLIERYWGGYVAMIDDSDAVHVIRDPSGAIPCYWHADAERSLVTSDPASCVDSGLFVPQIDWSHLAGHLLRYEDRNRQTALLGLKELFGGERLSITDRKIELATLWTPWTYARRDGAIDSENDAIDRVGRAVRNSVRAWGRRYNRPLVSLSGGLDSSIIATALASLRPNCVTISTDEPAGDERPFARQVADRIGSTLLEQSFSLEYIDIHRSTAARLPRPVSRLFAQELDRNWITAIGSSDANALFHGGGGDNIFCYLTSAAPYLDALLSHGLGRASRRTLRDVAALTESSIFAVLRGAVRKLLLHGGRYHWREDRVGLTRKTLLLAKEASHHPWLLARPRRILPGKQAQVASLVRIQNHLDAIEPSRIVPVVAPLLSQPVIEECLRVPSWMWCRGGINRSIARRAFAADLPQSIIERRDKGTSDSFDASIVERNRAAIADMLRNGLLARHDMIDLNWVARALAGSGPIRGLDYLRITMFVDVEAWLQSWSAKAGISSPPRT